MTAIISQAPFFDRPTAAVVRGRSIRVKRDQIIVWLSISAAGVREFDPRTPRWPALLDTGCNHNLVIHSRHLTEWAGLHPGLLRRLADIRVHDRNASQFAANIWLHANQRGRRDELKGRPPLWLELSPGIAVVSGESNRSSFPRLPLLGLRAFRGARLRMTVDWARSYVTIRTPRRTWLF